MNRTFHLQFCSLRRSYLQTCQSAAGTLHLLSTSLNAERQRQEYQAGSTTLATLSILVGDEVALYRCAEKFNRLAHQYTVLRDSIAAERSPGSSAWMATTAVGAPQTKALKQSQHSDQAIEVLQTMCLIIAYAIQRVANILGCAAATTSATADEDQQIQDDEDDVFDIDPLLMPLLYLCEQQQRHKHDSIGDGNRTGGTFMDVFRASTQMTLGYINEHLRGADLNALEVIGVMDLSGGLLCPALRAQVPILTTHHIQS